MRVTVNICLLSIFVFVSGTASIRLQEKNFQLIREKLAHLGFSALFWERVRLGSLNVSNKCHRTLKDVLRNAGENHEEAKKLLNVSGSFPKAIKSLSYADEGDYRGCLDLKMRNISSVSGQYCALSLQPDFERIEKDLGLTDEEIKKIYPEEFDKEIQLDIKIGLCVPSICTADDVDKLMEEVIESVYWKQNEVAICQVQKGLVEKVKDAKNLQKFFLLLVAIYSFFIVRAAYLDFVQSDCENSENTISSWYHYLSPRKNFLSLTTQDHGQLKQLNALRIYALSMAYLIHAIFWFTTLPGYGIFPNMEAVKQSAKTLIMQPIYSAWFFEGLVCAGALSSTSNIYRKVKDKKSSHEYFWILFERFFRYQPLILFAVICEFLLPLVGTGPFFPFYYRNKYEHCKKMIFHQIFGTAYGYDFDQMCAQHFWTFSMEMQFLVISVVLIYLFHKKKTLGWVLALSLIFYSFFHMLYVFLAHNLNPIYFAYPFKFSDSNAYINRFWNKAINHIWSHVAIVIGVKLIADASDHSMKQSRIIKIFIFLSVLYVTNTFLSVPFTLYDYISSPAITILYVTYTSIVNVLWCLFLFAIDSKNFQRSIRNIGKKSESSSKKSSSNNPNEGHQKSLSKVSRRRAGFWTILRRVLKAGYFVHGSLLNWYLTTFEKQIPALSRTHFWHAAVIYLLIYFGGFVNYIFLVGPWERFFIDLRTKLTNRKPQSKEAIE